MAGPLSTLFAEHPFFFVNKLLWKMSVLPGKQTNSLTQNHKADMKQAMVCSLNCAHTPPP